MSTCIDGLQHGVEPGSLITTLGTTDAGILVDPDDEAIYDRHTRYLRQLAPDLATRIMN
jgi:hypothetical protein